jgi:hypothetical protein
LEIYIANTNHFIFVLAALLKCQDAEVQQGKFTLKYVPGSKFYKILLKAPHNRANLWLVGQDS